jgi:hypothetical protein
MILIGAMTMETIIRQDRTNIPIELDRFVGTCKAAHSDEENKSDSPHESTIKLKTGHFN